MIMKKEKLKGFTYIEIIISVFLLSVGIISLVQLVSKGVNLSVDSRDEMIASQLAQEGVELVRNVRDNNRVQGQASFDGFGLGSVETCIDITYDTHSDPALTSGCTSYRLAFDTLSKKYFHQLIPSGTVINTKFYRKILISVLGDEKLVESVVWWNESASSPATCSAGKKCISAQSVLTRWLE